MKTQSPPLAKRNGSASIALMHAVRFSVIRRALCLLALLGLLAGCAGVGKSSRQVALDLWKGWAEIDQLMQQEHPDAVPIVLVHGWNGSEFTWPDPERLKRLEARLGRDIYYFNYRTGALPGRYPPLEALEEKLERFFAGFERVDVVAHSMGGLLMRQYLSHHPEGRVRRLVMLSTPHFGANAAALLAGVATSLSAEGNAQAQEIMPGSAFLWQINGLEGAELAGVEVLNAYAVGDDLVVAPHTAWLPWAPNLEVPGDHHTLSRNLDRFEAILRFLETGALPERLAPMPARRDVWLRMRRADGSFARFSEASVQRFDERGLPTRRDIGLCCEARSALIDPGATTVIIENTAPRARIRLFDRAQNPPREIHLRLPAALAYPVTLLVLDEDGRVIERPEGRYRTPSDDSPASGDGMP